MTESQLDDTPPFIARYRWRIRLGTVLTVVVLGGSLIAVWYLFLRAPGPRRVCEHVAHMRRQFPQEAERLEEALATLSMGDPPRASLTGNDQQCVWFFATEHKQLGFFGYGRLARCVTGAESPRELYPCL